MPSSFEQNVLLTAQRNRLEKSENGVDNREKMVRARFEYFDRIKADSDIVIFIENEEPTLIQSAYRSAFQSHVIRAVPKFSHAGEKKEKSTQKRRKWQKFDEKTTSKFYDSQEYMAQFRYEVGKEIGQLSNHDLVQGLIRELRAPNPPGKNVIYLLTGVIGCGKSTLASNLSYKISKIEDKQEKEREGGFLPISCAVIDFEQIPMPDKSGVGNYIKECVDPYITGAIRAQTGIYGGNFEEILHNKGGKNLVLIFDNLDSLYHQICSCLFLKRDEADEHESMRMYHTLVVELIKAFINGQYSNFGVSCIFAIREETLNALKGIDNTDDLGKMPLYYDIKKTIVLLESNPEHLKDILIKRLKLARDVSADRRSKESIDKIILEFSQPNVGLIDLVRYSVQGLRHTIDSFSKLCSALDETSKIVRIMCNIKLLKMFILVSGKKHYSQVNEGMTNIFLVNNIYRMENNPIVVGGGKLFTDEYLVNHPQNYWLKFFVLYRIEKGATGRGGIISLFHNVGGYDEYLVRLVLFSLAEVRHGRLIRPKIRVASDGTISSLGLEATARGKVMIENKEFWSFVYLAAVVEDTWMEVPVVFKEIFDQPFGFSFIGSSEGAYLEELRKFLLEKIDTVFLFLSILESTLKKEMKTRPALFKKLKELGVEIPNFGKIREGCADEVIELAADLPESSRVEIHEKLKKNTSRLSRVRWWWKMRAATKKCYGL